MNGFCFEHLGDLYICIYNINIYIYAIIYVYIYDHNISQENWNLADLTDSINKCDRKVQRFKRSMSGNHQLSTIHADYPLVMTNIAMENHHV